MDYHEILISFFKKHHLYDENMFNYFRKNTTVIDYNDKDKRVFIGCFYKLEGNILTKIHLTLPNVIDEATLLINIHELTHAIYLFKYLNKEFNEDITLETLPLLYEKLYILDNPSKELEAYSMILDKHIESNGDEYNFALSIRDILVNNYHGNLDEMITLTKKLVRTSNLKHY